MFNIVLAFVISAIVSYLLGCIPSAYMVGKSFKGVDIRQVGSHNMGAMNTFYAIGFWPGMLVLGTDICKAMLALTLSYWTTVLLQVPSNQVVPVEMVAGIFVIAGHNFPVFLKFRGGKGVAVYIGILIGLFWPAAIVFCVIWLTTAIVTRYSSLSALVASVVTPIFLWWFGHPALASLFAVLTLLLFYMHRENIKRLQAGTEGKIGK